MKEIQKNLQRFEEERPLMRHIPYWYANRAHAELEELEEELVDDPNIWERQRIASELADVMLFLIPIANNYGIDLTEAIISKMATNDTRFKPDDFNGTNFPDFKSAYAAVKASEGKPIKPKVDLFSSSFERDNGYPNG